MTLPPEAFELFGRTVRLKPRPPELSPTWDDETNGVGVNVIFREGKLWRVVERPSGGSGAPWREFDARRLRFDWAAGAARREPK